MSELQDYLKKKYNHLSNFINSESNQKGLAGIYCKNGDYNNYYDKLNRFTPDPRYFFWMELIKKQQKLGNISIYRDKPNGKLFYLIIKGKEDIFLKKFPDGCSI